MKDWLKSYSGKLSAIAASVAGIFTYDAAGIVLSALGFMPSSPVRFVLVIAVVIGTIWFPKKAAEKDAKTD